MNADKVRPEKQKAVKNVVESLDLGGKSGSVRLLSSRPKDAYVTHEEIAGLLPAADLRVDENVMKQILDTGLFARRSEFVQHRDYVLEAVRLQADQHNQNYQGVLSILAQVTSNTQRLLDELRGDCAKLIEILARFLPTDSIQELIEMARVMSMKKCSSGS